MRPELIPTDPVIIYLEIFFLLLTTISAFLIYFMTREIYQLTEHKGIKYFRRGFLFIAFANLGLLSTSLFMGLISKRFGFEFFVLLNLIGVGYLFASIYSNKIREYFIYLLTITVFLIGFIFRTRAFILLYSSVLIIALGVISFMKLKTEKRKKHFSQIYIIYILIFSSWLFMLIGRVFDDIYTQTRLYNDIITCMIFLYILYLTSKKLK